MEIIPRITVEPCPRCNAQPQLAQKGRFQVRCGCGACGPEARSEFEAARRWKSVAHYMRQHQAYVGEQLQIAVRDKPAAKAFIPAFARKR